MPVLHGERTVAKVLSYTCPEHPDVKHYVFFISFGITVSSNPTIFSTPVVDWQANTLTFRYIPVVFYKLNTKYNYRSKHNKNYCIMFYNMFYNYMFRQFFFRPSSGCIH